MKVIQVLEIYTVLAVSVQQRIIVLHASRMLFVTIHHEYAHRDGLG